MTTRRRVLILGAAGRDFHDFNVVFRDDPAVEVIAFTASQIPGIGGRRYPPDLAGPLYPAGIPIRDEAELPDLLRDGVDGVVFAYSDVSHAHVMRLASVALACGADFELLGPRRTMLPSHLPVIAVCAVRTGCGKSQTTRYLAAHLRARPARRRGATSDALRRPDTPGGAALRRARRHRCRRLHRRGA